MQPSTRVEHEHPRPFLPLGRVDRRENEIILVDERRPGLAAGGFGRIQRELGEEALARGIGGCDLGQLHKVGLTKDRVVMDALEMRCVPAAD